MENRKRARSTSMVEGSAGPQVVCHPQDSISTLLTEALAEDTSIGLLRVFRTSENCGNVELTHCCA